MLNHFRSLLIGGYLAVAALLLATAAAPVQAATVLTNFTLIDGTGHAPAAGSALIIGDDAAAHHLGRACRPAQGAGR